MLKKIRIKSTLLMFLALMLVLSQTAFAGLKPEEFDIVKAKQALVEKHKHEFNPSLTEKEKKERNDEVLLLLNRVVSGVEDAERVDNYLKEMNIYKLEIPEDGTRDIVPLSQPNDVVLNKPIIYQDAQSGYWFAAGGGYWANTNWNNDYTHIWLGYVGETKDIGKYDSVGLTYYNTSGTYNATVLSSMGLWHDGFGNEQTTTNPSHGDGKFGVAFDYQDQVYISSINWLTGAITVRYRGHGFGASVVYNSNFTNWNGKARTLYAHTWNSTNVSSISFNGSATNFGATINFSNDLNRFSAFNGADTSF
ncbi:hypothetical protein ACF3MZ_24685 [Paenibacillaceae bacterium WGS1546]|uniref:hypothetical protein n=1 Tax=Cohnella sp. WGS1546 TaxID=3366810 RepID=UPI00372D28CA